MRLEHLQCFHTRAQSATYLHPGLPLILLDEMSAHLPIDVLTTTELGSRSSVMVRATV